MTYRHNQELEQEQFRLEQEAEGLAQRLDAGSNFDADTPIDKTLTFLQSIVKVSIGACACILVAQCTLEWPLGGPIATYSVFSL